MKIIFNLELEAAGSPKRRYVSTDIHGLHTVKGRIF